MKSPCPDFAAICTEEIAFAMTMFLAASDLEIPHKRIDRRPVGNLRFGPFYGVVSENICELEPPVDIDGNTESTLEFAFSVLWQHYEGDPRRSSICARILGFHCLMVTTDGGLVAGWLLSEDDNEKRVTLHPAVVEAVAMTPLQDNGMMTAIAFLQTLQHLTRPALATA